MVVPGIGKAMLAVLSLLGLLVYLFVESQPLLNDRSVFPSTTDLVVAVISVVVEMLMATGLAQKLSYMMLDMATSGKPAGAGHRSAAVLSAAVLTRLGPWDRGAHARSDRRRRHRSEGHPVGARRVDRRAALWAILQAGQLGHTALDTVAEAAIRLLESGRRLLAE